MNDTSKKLLQEYEKITERKLLMAKENWRYCCDNGKKYGYKYWQEGIDKHAIRMTKHECKLNEIRSAFKI